MRANQSSIAGNSAALPSPPVRPSPSWLAGRRAPTTSRESSLPHRTALAMAVAAIAIVVLGAFLVTGGRGAKAGSPGERVAGLR